MEVLSQNILEKELVEFGLHSENSRVWVYTADRQLTVEEISFIENQLAEFTRQWTAHDVSLNALGKIIFSRFLILSVDEEPQIISGCGIDKSVHLIQKLSNNLDINFMDRSNIYFYQNDQVKQVQITDLTSEYQAENFDDTSPVFNTMIQNLKDLRGSFISPFAQSPFYRLIC